MIKSKFKKIILSSIAILLVICMGSVAFATDSDDALGAILNELRQNENGNIVNSGDVEQIQEGTNTNTNTNTLNVNSNTNTNTNVNENRPATTPHAGAGDYSGLIFVAVFAISTIYAYKKVKEYNA